MSKSINRIDMVYGRLTVKRLSERVSKSSRGLYWVCKCQCGNFKEVSADHLKQGNVKSCGCLKIENALKQSLNNKQKRQKTNDNKNNVHNGISAISN